MAERTESQAMTNGSNPQGDQRLSQARVGSHGAFRALVEPYEAELQRHCYRMTGSMDDADDLVQETLLRAWRGLDTYVSRGSFRAWLYQIATHRTLDLLKSSSRTREVVNSANEPPWLQPYPHDVEPLGTDAAAVQHEQIGLAFIAALHNLPGRPRAALILRDVLGFSAKETAGILDCSVPAANSALQRARSKMAAIHPTSRTEPSTAEETRIAAQLVDAWKSADTEALVKLLHDTINMTMPPHTLELFGPRNTADFLIALSTNRSEPPRFEATTANWQQGVATYLYDQATDRHTRHCLMFIETSGPTIHKITSFDQDRIFELLDLPKTIDP